MNNQVFDPPNFQHPPILYRMEDLIKGLVGEKFLYRDFINNFHLQGDEQILDFGCGGGVGTRCVAKRLGPNGTVTGIDTSGFMLKKAQKRLRLYPQARCIQGDIRSISLPAESMDIIMIMRVLHDIPSIERSGVIASLARVIKQEGVLHILEPIREKHGMPVAEIQRLFHNAGFEELTREIQTNKSYRGSYQLIPGKKPDVEIPGLV